MNSLLTISKNLPLKHLVSVPRYTYIHYEDHARKINIPKEPLSFEKPSVLRKDQPQRIHMPTSRRLQRIINEKKFRSFRDKMIASDKAIYEAYMPDELWGLPLQERPKHYHQIMSNTELFTVPGVQPRARPVTKALQYNPALVKDVDFNNLDQYSPKHLINIALQMRQTSDFDRKHWFEVESRLQKHLPYLDSTELIQLKWSLSGPPKFGSVDMMRKLNDLILGDLDQLNLDQLLGAFCAFNNEKNYSLQGRFLARLTGEPKFLKHINSSAESVISVANIYAKYRIPIYRKKLENRSYNEGRVTAQNFLNLLDFERYVDEFTPEQILEMLRNFHSLKVVGYKHILLKVDQRLHKGLLEQISPADIPELIFLLSKVEDGEGFIKYSTFEALKAVLLANWASYTDYQKVKSLYCYWNIESWTEDLQQLYAELPVGSDISSLYYFAQIELLNSTGKEADIIKGLTESDYIPLPFYYKFKQFFIQVNKYFGDAWAMNHIEEKLKQTEYHFDCSRSRTNLLNDYRFTELGKFLAMHKGSEHQWQHMVQVENTEMVQYGYEYLRIAVEFVPDRELLPEGKRGLRKSYQARILTLQNCGWYPITISWIRFLQQPLSFRYTWLAEMIKQGTEHQTNLLAEEEWSERERIAGIGIARVMSHYGPDEYEALAKAKHLEKYRFDYVPPAETSGEAVEGTEEQVAVQGEVVEEEAAPEETQ